MGGLGCRGAAPASIKHKTYFVHRARRAGRRSRRARRAQASAGSASRAEPGKGETRFEPSVSRIWQKQNVLAYVCDMLYICFSLYYLYLVCNRAPTHGGLGCRGAAPCHECAPSLYKKSEQVMYSLLRHESKDHVLIPNAHPANFSL